MPPVKASRAITDNSVLTLDMLTGNLILPQNFANFEDFQALIGMVKDWREICQVSFLDVVIFKGARVRSTGTFDYRPRRILCIR